MRSRWTRLTRVSLHMWAHALSSMSAKCYYTTTIIADVAYTNVISNGDLAPGFHGADTRTPAFQPVPSTV